MRNRAPNLFLLFLFLSEILLCWSARWGHFYEIPHFVFLSVATACLIFDTWKHSKTFAILIPSFVVCGLGSWAYAQKSHSTWESDALGWYWSGFLFYPIILLVGLPWYLWPKRRNAQ